MRIIALLFGSNLSTNLPALLVCVCLSACLPVSLSPCLHASLYVRVCVCVWGGGIGIGKDVRQLENTQQHWLPTTMQRLLKQKATRYVCARVFVGGSSGVCVPGACQGERGDSFRFPLTPAFPHRHTVVAPALRTALTHMLSLVLLTELV
jgi:hypothetical protein